jgi:hypothetical protein
MLGQITHSQLGCLVTYASCLNVVPRNERFVVYSEGVYCIGPCVRHVWYIRQVSSAGPFITLIICQPHHRTDLHF